MSAKIDSLSFPKRDKKLGEKRNSCETRKGMSVKKTPPGSKRRKI